MAEDGDTEWSTTTPSFRFRWDVFLSFRGEDTRYNFTGRLYAELVRNGVRAFFDEERPDRDDEISPSRLTAIEDSAVSIAVISENYASSCRCLEELAKIIECRRLLLPVFYKVDPSHVRRQTEPFEKDLRNLEFEFGVERVLRWRKAMEKAGGIAGWDTKVCLPSSLRGLSILKSLFLSHCKQLKVLPPLPSSLVHLNVANCTALESVPDLSNLESLQDLQLTNCKKLMDIPGLECLKSLRWLYTTGCTASFAAVNKRLTKVLLKHIHYLGVPGSQIPNWFVPEIPSFSTPKNRELKDVIVAVVVSLDQQNQDNFIHELPRIMDIQVKIIRLNEQKFTSVLDLRGIPDTDEDQLYLCRFQDHSFVRMLKEGDKIQVGIRSPRPYYNGIVLKKYGIYLVYENDDDIEDDDVESQESVTERLSKFFSSL